VRSIQKVLGAPARHQASFAIALGSYSKKNFSDWFGSTINRVLRHLPTQKPSQKYHILTSEGRRFRSSFYLLLKQVFKAVLMGVVSSIVFFWSNTANPAMRKFWAQAVSEKSYNGCVYTILPCGVGPNELIGGSGGPLKAAFWPIIFPPVRFHCQNILPLHLHCLLTRNSPRKIIARVEMREKLLEAPPRPRQVLDGF
jgi:hypothetical protein